MSKSITIEKVENGYVATFGFDFTGERKSTTVVFQDLGAATSTRDHQDPHVETLLGWLERYFGKEA